MPLRNSTSFSERIGLARQERAPWQRSHSHPTHLQTPSAKAPLPVSAVTKDKLNKFIFQGRGDASTEGDAKKDADDGGLFTDNGSGSGSGSKSSTSALKTKKAGSSTTPLTRLDWKDLAEPYDTAAEVAERSSPHDRLLWNNKLDPTAFHGPSPMMSRRKRARSSSPPMSPTPGERFESPTVNVKQLAKALRSPHPDPTLELWDRYSLRGPDGQSATTTAPALAQLMVSASPRHAGNAGAAPTPEKGDLRRAMSCGLLWPKRRRIERARSASQTSAGQRELEAASKSSLVSALLDSVTSSIQEEVGPDEELALAPGLDSPSIKKGRVPPPPGETTPVKIARGQRQPSISDYDDDDDDLDDTFLELEAKIQASQTADASQPIEDEALELPESPRQLLAGMETETARSRPVPQANAGPPAKERTRTNLDELDEFADDFFDDDDIFDDLDIAELEFNSTSMTQEQVHQRPSSGPHQEQEQEQGQGQEQEQEQEQEGKVDGESDSGADHEAAHLAAPESTRRSNAAPTPKQEAAQSIQRYLIQGVLDGDFVDQYGRTSPEKILIIQADGLSVTKTVHLRGAWFDTPAHRDCYVHVIGEFSPKGQCIVDDVDNLLILHPDQLVSATVVADSFGCLRRAVLQDRVKATSEASPPLVYGTMLHEIFQEALFANRWDLAFLSRVIDKNIEKHVEDLYTIKVGVTSAKEHLQSKMTELSTWAKSFVATRPQTDAIVEGRNGERATMAVRKLLDVEEHVWSPKYGLKGNIDATVEVMMTDGKQARVLTVPFEVKTGKHANSNHMAQTALYTLLLSDRYDVDIAYGILYYMETSRTLRIPAVRHELRHMILQRNQLACYIRERSVQLPPMLKNKHMCGKCYAKTSCFTYHRLADDGNGETSGMKDKFDDLVQHLTPRHREFFIKWENLLTLEEKESQKMKRELWTMTSAEREKKSRCFGDVIIEEGSAAEDVDDPRINRFQYTFIKRKPSRDFTFIGSELTVGEPVVVSDEEGHYALAIGYVTSVHRRRITVAVDRRLHNARTRQPGFDEVNNQTFASIMEVAPPAAVIGPRGEDPGEDLSDHEKSPEPPVRYRLDRDEFSNGMATVRNNIVQMMANEVPAAMKIRELIVDLVPPRFKTVATQYSVADGDSLNVDQKRAIEKVMSAQDYALVLGMPGTGKTTTIAHIIRALVSQGKTVLLTSHTHTAVDNILLKLKSDKTPILRLGAPAKVHPEVRDFAHLGGQSRRTFEEIEEAWHGTPIVATTCLGINHPIFLERAFDFCIVDEASQITLPICAGPIRLARTFVLVGDHNQLPPVVKNVQAREGGLDVSLFKLLSDAHPPSVVHLAHQYRMCEDIMTLSNTLIYGGKLCCGTEELRTRKLDVPDMSALRQHHYDDAATVLQGLNLYGASSASTLAPRSICAGPFAAAASAATSSRCWLHDLLDGEARVRFVDTDTIQPPVGEEVQGSRIVNRAEAHLVFQLVEALLSVGVPAHEIGVMTHYRAQLFLLKDRLRARPGVEMHTTDRFQGRDKEAVVLSLVRSNEACSIGELLKDWRRINVAFTRAKTKLLVVGSMRTLRDGGKDGKDGEGSMLSRFIKLMEERDWIYHLPGDALTSHCFEEQGTQWTAGGPSQQQQEQKQRQRQQRQRLQQQQQQRHEKEKQQQEQQSQRRPQQRIPGEKSPGGAEGKENQRPAPKRVGISDRMLLKGKLLTRDILNEMTDGAYYE